MSILIKNMEMPKDCLSCRFHHMYWCTLTNIYTNTAQCCPLIEIQPHGRLIDADALLQRAVPHGWSTPKWVSDIRINDAPTIIEAEEGE